MGPGIDIADITALLHRGKTQETSMKSDGVQWRSCHNQGDIMQLCCYQTHTVSEGTNVPEQK